MKKLDFLVLSRNFEVAKRCQDCAQYYNFSFEHYESVEQLSKQESLHVLFIVVAGYQSQNHKEVIELVQGVKQILPLASILALVPKKLTHTEIEFFKKSGANAVLIEEEFFDASKLEFIASQVIRASYIPVKIGEFVLDTTIDFFVYHMMPVNGKFLPIFHKGLPVTSNKIEKAFQIGEVYVKREDLSLFKKYVLEHKDLSAKGLISRCRAQYLSLSTGYADLVLLLTNQSEASSYDAGKDLYHLCQTMAGELINSLGAVGDAWSIVTNASISEFGQVERAPAVASYAGLLSLMSGIGTPEEVMIASLLADIGFVDLPSQLNRKIQTVGLEDLNEGERVVYEQHPNISLFLAQSRKIPVPQNIQQIIRCTHERADRKGFPSKVLPENIPLESQLIQFCDFLDKESMITMGRERKDISTVRKALFQREFDSGQTFAVGFMNQIKEFI